MIDHLPRIASLFSDKENTEFGISCHSHDQIIVTTSCINHNKGEKAMWVWMAILKMPGAVFIMFLSSMAE